jgi:hypothetical protein
VRGPGHYTIKRPKRVAQPQPAPTPTAEAAPSTPRRNQPSIRFANDFDLPTYWSPVEEQVTRNSRQRIQLERMEQVRRRAQAAAAEAAVNEPVAAGPDSNQTVVMDTAAVPSSTATDTGNETRNALRDLERLERQMRDVFVNRSNQFDVYGEPYSYYEDAFRAWETVPSTPPSRQSASPARRRGR